MHTRQNAHKAIEQKRMMVISLLKKTKNFCDVDFPPGYRDPSFGIYCLSIFLLCLDNRWRSFNISLHTTSLTINNTNSNLFKAD